MRFKGLFAAVAFAVGLPGAAQAAPLIDFESSSPGDFFTVYGVSAKTRDKHDPASPYTSIITSTFEVADIGGVFGNALAIPTYSRWNRPSLITIFTGAFKSTVSYDLIIGNTVQHISYPAYSDSFRLSFDAKPGTVFIDNFQVVSGFAGAVPEPSTWAIMILGFGAVGFAMRRRSKVSFKTQLQPS